MLGENILPLVAHTDPKKKEKIYDILTLLKSVVDGSKRIHIFVNVKKENLQKLLSELPALRNPTVAPLADEDWYSVNHGGLVILLAEDESVHAVQVADGQQRWRVTVNGDRD